MRLLETAQYINKMKEFDYDILLYGVGIGQPPTLELISYFHSRNARVPLGSNRSGIQHWDKFGRPPIDAEFRTGFPETWWYDKDKAARITLTN